MKYLKKIGTKFLALFGQGLMAEQLAFSIAISLAVSLFPIFGVATLVLTILALSFKLNLPIMIAISYVAEPIKWLLFIPFINIGASIFGTEHTLLTFELIKTSYDNSFFYTLILLSYELLCGFMGWVVTIVPISILFYFLLKVLLEKSVLLRKPNTNR